MHFSILRKPLFLIPLAGLALAAGTVMGDPPNRPAWWLNGNPPIITGAAENNKGPANIGQAKHIADEALKALALKDQALSNTIRQALTTRQPDPAGGLYEKIIDLTVDSPKPTGWAEKQKAPLLLGQLKAIAAPFYTHLAASSPANATWLANERTANGTATSGSIYPWTAETNDDANKAIATIGQLKAVFSLRFDGLPLANIDENENGISDGLDDFDGDGMNSAEEYLAGRDPAFADPVTDSSSRSLDVFNLAPF